MEESKKIESSKETPFAVRLFNKSPLKQRKLKMISEFLEDSTDRTSLDIGSDNGVISYFLRKRGGQWHSADLIPETVEAISALVGENVHQIDGVSTPFDEATFDTVIIVDFLEHIEGDREFITELYRILKPGGTLLVNVPNPNIGLIRKMRYMLGQTDEAHGHLRPGYTLQELSYLLGESFVIEKHRDYSKVFSELIDTAITAALKFLKKGGETKKGTVTTEQDVKKFEKTFKIYSAIYPIIWIFAKLDSLVPFLSGNMLIIRAKKADRL